MAGYSDAPFRSICLEMGAFLCFTEMASAEALIRGSQKTFGLLQRGSAEHRYGIQIFAGSALSAAKAVRMLTPYQADLIDLNCGCSVPKILKSGCGAALLRDPSRIREIVKAMASETDNPITVKLRSGWEAGQINYLENAQAAVEGGAALICLHPRTRSQGFSGSADRSHLKILKRTVPVPIIGSGDLFTAKDALNMVRETECDGVMFARGALGNPFIFRQAVQLFSGQSPDPPPAPEERLALALKQLRATSILKGEKKACTEMRKAFAAYTKGIPGASLLRKRVVKALRISEYESIVADFRQGTFPD
ncbi:MAG TPA: tRNA dihydrouridine synthase DusB [bacterium]|nr:tRNA dihydrouridine synthase DusB [bacterium]